MSVAFEALISSYLETQVGQSTNFQSIELSNNLRANILRLQKENQFHAAGIGAKDHLKTEALIRKDIIYWLDRSHNDVHENSFLDLIDAFVLYLNSTCYTGITSYEFHYAIYEPGSFYRRHLDQFQTNKNRAFSMIIYLNENWQIEDGGMLCIYHKDTTQMISPIAGNSVFFKSSDLEHEVLESFKPRLSITGWLKTS